MRMTKRVLSIIMAIVTLVSVMGIAAEAASVVVKEDINYGYMVPVNYNGTEVLSTVKVYGSYDYINFYMYAKKYFGTYFFYEIFSDSKLTKCIQSDCIEVEDEGAYTYSVKLKLKGNFSTKTYYVVTYAARYDEDKDSMVIDADSMCKFKLAVDRTTSFSKQKVMLKETKNTTKGAYITWSKLSGASKYYIYRRSLTGTKWTKVGTVSSSYASFTDTSVKNINGKFVYTVKAINKNGTASRYLYSGLTCLFAKTPVMSSVSVVYNNAVEIKWGKTSPSAKYDIYRKEGSGSWKKIKSSYSGTTYKDTTAKNNKKYTYTVRAVIPTSYGTAISSYYSNSDKAITYLEAPILDEVAVVDTGINVSWNAVSGAKAYTVYRKPLDGSTSWKALKKVGPDVTSYIDTTASITDGAYIYTVRSEGDGFRGSYSSGKEYFVLSQPEFDVSVDTNGIHMSWEKSPYATSYRILEQKGDGTWIIKAKTNKTTYDFKPSTYYTKKLSVCAVRNDVEGPYKTDVEATVYFPSTTPTFKEFDTYTKIEWQSTYANMYRVYRKLKNAPDTDYELFYECKACSFINGSPEDDVAYTYQIRGVYGDVEQYNNLVSKTHTRFSPEDCIESFKVNKETRVFNYSYKSGDEITEYYCFDVDKTDSFKNATTDIYYLQMDSQGTEVWTYMGDVYKFDVNGYKVDVKHVVNRIDPPNFSCVVSNSKGSTPIGVKPIYLIEESCDAPEIKLTPTINGFKLTWGAVDDAVSYDVFVDFEQKTDYEKTFKADGSSTYSVSFTDIDYFSGMVIRVTAVHENGNRTCRDIDYYCVYEAPKLIKAAAKNNAIEVIWDGEMREYYAVFRKAEGESSWTVVDKKEYETKFCTTIDGVEYTGFCFTDKTAKKGVKYTYTVRIYDPQTNEYVSYYNTKGVSAKR